MGKFTLARNNKLGWPFNHPMSYTKNLSSETPFGYSKHINVLEKYFSKEAMADFWEYFTSSEMYALAYAFAHYVSDVPDVSRADFARACIDPVFDRCEFNEIDDGEFGEALFFRAIGVTFYKFKARHNFSDADDAYTAVSADTQFEQRDPSQDFFDRMLALRLSQVGEAEEHELIITTPKRFVKRGVDWPPPFIAQPLFKDYDWSLFEYNNDAIEFQQYWKDKYGEDSFNKVWNIPVPPKPAVTYSQAMALRRIRKAAKRALGHVSRTASRGSSSPRESAPSARYQSKINARFEREELQRQEAKKRAEEERKRVPKAEREKSIKQQRDKRNPVYQSRLRPSVIGSNIFSKDGAKFRLSGPVVQFQSGLRLLAGVAASVAMAKVGSFFGRLVGSVDKASSVLSTLPERVTNAVKKFSAEFKRVFGCALWYIPLILSLFYTWHRLSISSPLIVTIFVAAISASLGPKIWSICSKFFQSRTEFQSGLNPGFGANAPKLLAALFTFSVFKDRKSSSVSEFIKRMSLLPRATEGWSLFLTWFTDAIQWCVNLLRRMFGKDRVQIFSEQHAPVKAWMRDVDELRKLCWTEKSVTPEDLKRMVKVVSEGFTYKELYRNTPMGRSVETYLASMASELGPYQGALRASNNFRFEPSMMMMVGEPGVGKTLMAMPFCISVLKLSGIVPANASFEDTVSQIWQKGNSEFWNGYAGQECLVMDDAFQAKVDKSDKENDYMSIIRMVSSWSFPLNFADLASKGKIYFGSKFIFGTTNLKSIVSEANSVIQEPEAVLRRLNYPVGIRVKSDFAMPDGKLNFTAFKSELERCKAEGKGVDAYPWHVWEYCRHDFERGVDLGDWRSIRLLLHEVSDGLRQKFEYHDHQKAALSSLVDSFGEIEFQSKKLLSLDTQALSQTCVDFSKELHLWQKDASVAQNFISLVVRVLAYSAIFGLVTGIMKAVWSLFSSLFGLLSKPFARKKHKAEPQSNIREKGYRVRPVKSSSPVLQGVNDVVCTNIYSNSYKMYYTTNNDGVMAIGQVLFIKDRLAVFPAHFRRDIMQADRDGSGSLGQCLHFRHSQQCEFDFAVSFTEFLSWPHLTLEDQELTFVQFAAGRAHRNISTNFIRESDVRYLGGHPVRLDVCDISQRGVMINRLVRKIFVSQKLELGTKLAIQGRSVSRYLKYIAATTNGDCGAPLCAHNPDRFSGRVCFGVHFAGTVDLAFGYSAIVTQELIEQASKKLVIVEDRFEEDLASREIVFNSSFELPFNVAGSFLPLYKVDRAVSISPKSSYFVTPEYGTLGEYEYTPAHLSPVVRNGQLIYPMNKAVGPYSTPLLHYEQPWLKQAVYVATRPLFSLIQDRNRDIYSFDQAVLGVSEEKFRSIPRSTACGYPYCLDHKNGKVDFFGSEDDYILTSPDCVELRERCAHVVECARKRQRLSHVFVDFLKDELRSPAKNEAVQTRLISSAPLDYTIVFRQYFGAFSAACMSVPVRCGMAPGINCYSDWDQLACQLQKKGDHVFDGDFKSFDSSEQPCVHDVILDVVNDWYDDGPENATIRKVLWLELTHSRHIGGTGYDQRHIYQWNKSLPSGHPFTTIVNSIYSLTLLVGAYISKTGDWKGFWDHISAVTYGDDNVVNVSPTVEEVYNQRGVSEALKKEFSVVYTPGDKSGEFKDSMTIQEVTFLKRSFRKENKRWLCPLDPNSFLYTAYWCKNSRLMRKIIVDDLENALEELSMHPETMWNQYGGKIVQRLRLNDSEPKCIPTRADYLAAVLRRLDDWY